METERERVGVFGGSFDPPHVGHVLLATWALSAGGIDRLIVVPTFAHVVGKKSAPFEDRVTMARAAFSILDPARVEVSRIEERLPPPSFTIHTLRALSEEHPGAAFRLLVGADVLGALPRWHDVEGIEAIAPLLVGGRSGHAASAEGRSVEADVPSFPEVSSTVIRARLAAGQDVRSLVPELVLTHLRARGLYRVEELP